ncbi:MAG TPA: hypothetical protein VGN57_06610 [Pirellulaceae bacterium]|jgi:hypothetical protein|nr:hypothetical protein [Pirellulaceae bacterium]
MIPDLPDNTNALVLSYFGIRRAIGLIGAVLPVVLGPVGWLLGIEIQDNISSYYHTGMRNVFVGAMCAIGGFLFCYRGADRIETLSARFGCISALGVALFPLDANSDPLLQKTLTGYLHSLSGGAFFLTLAIYSLYHFPRSTEKRSEHEPHPWERLFIYRASGVVIVLSMLAMGTFLALLPGRWKAELNDYHFLFWMEWIAIWAFAGAWLTKGRAMVADIAVELLSIPREALADRLPNLRRAKER